MDQTQILTAGSTFAQCEASSGESTGDAEFEARVCETICNLKLAPAANGNWLAIFDRDEWMAGLDPITWHDVDAPDSIRLLAEWREAAQNSFPAIFPVTLEGTRRWLIRQVLEVPDRLLFWVQGAQGQKIGHVGVNRIDFAARNLELDNIVRGVPRVLRGAMYSSVQTVLNWVFVTLDMHDVFVRSFSHNARAIRLYEHCGFRETMRMPMRRVEDNNVIRWEEVDGSYRQPVERYLVTMHLARSAWQADSSDELVA